MEKLDLIDAIGDELWSLPDDAELPNLIRESVISKEWLINMKPSLKFWSEVQLRKALFWIPGRNRCDPYVVNVLELHFNPMSNFVQVHRTFLLGYKKGPHIEA